LAIAGVLDDLLMPNVSAVQTSLGLLEHYAYVPGPAGRDSVHVHAEVQVCLSVNFPGRYRSGRLAFDVPVGSVSVVDSWEPHAAEDPVDRPFVARYAVLYVAKGRWDALAAARGLDPRVGILVHDARRAARTFMRFDERARHGASALELDERFGAMMTLLLREARGRRQPEREASPAHLERAREFIRAHAAERISLADAAQQAGLSPQHFLATFRARYGVPPHRFQTLMRLDRARQLLARGMPAAEVAAACGLTDQSHLTRHFRRYLGVAPGRYRRQAPRQPV
jgi:AraC-like DNA-binding protein